MPFYRWDDMKKRNIVSTTDSRGAMVLGAFTTLTRQEQPPGKATRPHSHGCEQIIPHFRGRRPVPRRGGGENPGRGRGGPHPLGRGNMNSRIPGPDVLVYLSFKNRSEDWPPREALASEAAGE